MPTVVVTPRVWGVGPPHVRLNAAFEALFPAPMDVDDAAVAVTAVVAGVDAGVDATRASVTGGPDPVTGGGVTAGSVVDGVDDPSVDDVWSSAALRAVGELGDGETLAVRVAPTESADPVVFTTGAPNALTSSTLVEKRPDCPSVTALHVVFAAVAVVQASLAPFVLTKARPARGVTTVNVNACVALGVSPLLAEMVIG